MNFDVIFDIDGTLANAEHRLHFIKDPDKAKDWENFLSDEQVAGDTPIPEIWTVLSYFVMSGHRAIFITGRPERQRRMTEIWLGEQYECEHRMFAAHYWSKGYAKAPQLYMRKDGDRRPSHIVKRELLHRCRQDGFDPKLVFEDRKDDTAMWRSEGLLCCQVAEGDY